ncbi:hypothetical protein KAF25_003410 [Fusarium avenaceum]|uniref:Uncharacterized protein n=1 Tax=Fusarium avenaceum TaxID=40199 RepID=A0A9P7H141_9HYPO|nr:hypothetical protein KAF25_003410 [Fusarium avenaceum]
MKPSLLLALWSTGVLGGPCKPSKPSKISVADGTPTGSNHVSLGLSSIYLDLTKTGQDSEHETSTGLSPHESAQISVSIPFSESVLISQTQDTVSNTISLPEGSATNTGALPEPTSVGDSVPGTSNDNTDPKETSGDAGNLGSPSSPQTGGPSPAGTTVTPREASGTATSHKNSGNPSGTAFGFLEGSSGTLINTEISDQPTGTGDVQSEPGNTDDNAANGIPTTIPSGVSGDVSGTATNPESSGPSDIATAPGEPGSTDSPTGISAGVSGAPSGTATGSGEVDTTTPGGALGGASNTSFSASDSNPTEAATDGTTNTGPAVSHNSTNTSESPEETLSTPGNTTTSTEQGQDTATQTGPTPGTDIDPIGTETLIAGPDQSATTGPGNTFPNDEGTLTQTSGDDFTSTAAGDVPGDHSGVVTTDTNSIPTSLPGDQDETTRSQEQSIRTSSDQISDGNTNETSLGEDTTNEPVPDDTDTASTGSSEAGNSAISTGTVLPETTDSDSIPSTTMPGPSATANTITTATSTGTMMPVVTEAPPDFNSSIVGDYPEWTSNTWITTTLDSSEPTIVPVLDGCENCGGGGSGIIIWGFPPVPNTWFQLLGLPRFSFPCITPSSGCTSTPVTEEFGEDKDDDDKPSSATCTDKATVTDCFVACTTYTGPAGETVNPEYSECTTCNVDLTANEDSEALKGRSLERRGGVDIKKNIAGCDWSNSAVGTPRLPAYPGGNLVLSNEAAIVGKSPLDPIKRWPATYPGSAEVLMPNDAQFMDENAKNCIKYDAVITGVWSFANKYKAFMADRFTGNQDYSMNQGVVYAKNKLLTALATDVANAAKIKNIPAGDLNSWQKRLANMQDANRAWKVSVTFVWAGPTTSKRDTDGLSCDRPNPSFTTESTIEPTTDATTFATSFRISSDITTSDEVPPRTEQVTTSNNPPPLTDFPTLTQQIPDTTISTPDGSSCAETATITNCNIGTGGGHGLGGARGPPACIERETCNSWINTKTTSTTPSPTPTLTKPDPGQNEKHCYNSGQKSNYEAITYAAESFCRDVVNDQVQGLVWSNYKLKGKEVPSTGYHFKLAF